MFARSNAYRLTVFLIAGACACICNRVSAAEPAQPPEQRQKEIAQLIEQLASENPKPKQKTYDRAHRGPTTVFAPTYSVEKQKNVFLAAKKLLEFGTDAFPQLIENFDDSRYSFAEPAPNGENNSEYVLYSVGSHCRDIVFSQVNKFNTWGEPMRGFGPASDTRPEFQTKESTQRWWAKNKDKPVWRLQADGLQWAIDIELKTKQKDDWKAARAAETLEANRKLLDKLLTTQKPL
jgi:hypothetical protein